MRKIYSLLSFVTIVLFLIFAINTVIDGKPKEAEARFIHHHFAPAAGSVGSGSVALADSLEFLFK